MKSFFREMDLALVVHGSDEKRVGFLTDIKNYVKLGACINYKHKMKYLNHWGRSSTEVGRLLGVSDATVRSATLKMSTELWSQFGTDFFDCVKTKPGLAKKRFNVVKNYRGVDSLFLIGFKQLLVEPVESVKPVKPVESVESVESAEPVESVDIDIKNCKKEIEFLKKHAVKGMSEELVLLDQKKVIYVLDLLASETGDDVRVELINAFLK